MWLLPGLCLVQSLMLSFGQLTMKIALDRMSPFGWNWQFWGDLLTNWWFLLCGVLFGSASVLWMYIVKHYPLSMASPMVSLSYLSTAVLAAVFLHEDVSWNRWVGILIIMIGCAFVASK